jgi:hypothetical protein
MYLIKFQDHQEIKTVPPTPVQGHSTSGARKIPDDLVKTNTVSYSEPAVPNIAKAAAAEGYAKERSQYRQPQKGNKKPS